MSRRLLVVGLAGAVAAGCGGDGPSGLEEDETVGVRYTGTVTLDGTPPVGAEVRLLWNEADDREFRLTSFSRDRSVTAIDGAYEADGAIAPDQCDRIWLRVDFGGDDPPYLHYLTRGCGGHALELDVTTNVRVDGRITVDGAAHADGPVKLAVGRVPPDLRRLGLSTFSTDAAGSYSVSARLDPRFCGDLWIWVDAPEVVGGTPTGRVVDHFEEVPGCGPRVVDVTAAFN